MITMIIKTDYSDTKRMITEIIKIDSGDTMNLSNHRCDLFFYLRYDFCPNLRFGSKNQYPEFGEGHHPERSEEVR